MLKMQLCITKKSFNYILKYIEIENHHNNISQYYSFFCIFDQVNAVLMSIRD